MGLFGKKKDGPAKAEAVDTGKKKGKSRERAPEYMPVSLNEQNALEAQFMARVLAETGRRRAMRLLSLSLIANFVLASVCCFLLWWGVIYKRDIYFMATPDGRLQEMVPLTEPYLSTAGVANWVTQAVTETYTLNFNDWKRVLAKVMPFYGRDAWISLNKEIRPMIDQVEHERLYLYAVADEAPKLLAEGIYRDSRYVWRMEFPMTLTHQTSNSTKTFRWTVNVLVGRAVVAEKSDGVEILQFIITPRK